jgi:hypothetical protein
MARKSRKQRSKKSNAGGTTGKPRRQRDKGNDAKTRKDRNDDAKSRADASKNNTASWAAMGIGAAAAAAITAAALASFVASDGATIKFKSIKKNTDWFSGDQLDIEWELVSTGDPIGIPSAVQVVEDDTIEISGTDLPKLDGKTPKVVKVKSDNVFTIDYDGDASAVNLSDKGQGIIHTDFESQLGNAVDDATGGAADALGLDTLQDNLGLIFGIIGGVFFLGFIFWLLSKFKSNPNVKAN